MENTIKFNVENVEITKIYKSSTRKDGTPYVTKPTKFDPEGKAYSKVDIYIDPVAIDDMEFEGRLSMLDFNNNAKDWTEGTKITGVVVKNGDFWNFELPKTPRGNAAISMLREEVEQLKARVSALEGNQSMTTEPLSDDLPF